MIKGTIRLGTAQSLSCQHLESLGRDVIAISTSKEEVHTPSEAGYVIKKN